MNKILIVVILLTSLNALAECPIFIRNTFLNSDEKAFDHSIQQEILMNGLVDKGFNVVSSEDEATHVLDIKAEHTSTFNSIWQAKVNIYSTSGHKGYTVNASDRAITLPIHILSLGISTLIPTNGRFAMKKLVRKLPTCDQVTEDAKLLE